MYTIVIKVGAIKYEIWRHNSDISHIYIGIKTINHYVLSSLFDKTLFSNSNCIHPYRIVDMQLLDYYKKPVLFPSIGKKI